MSRALTIAGSDPSGGAGIQADLKVFTDLGVYGLSVITAVTAQNSKGVQKVVKMPPRAITAQIDSVTTDIGADACKIGMLYAYQAVNEVAERIRRREIRNVILDPVIYAKDGTRLLLARGVYRMKRALIPLCTLVSPNLVEAGELSGITVTDLESAKEAARVIHGFGARFVLIKGGHFEGEPVDLLYDGESFMEYSGKRIEGKSMHGTGCIMSAAIAAELAKGSTVPDAVRFAKCYVASAIESSIKLGRGGLWYFSGVRDTANIPLDR